MGAKQSHVAELEAGEEQEVEDYQDAEGPLPAEEEGQAADRRTSSSSASQGPKKLAGTKLYRHEGGGFTTTASKWTLVSKAARWKFAQLGTEEDEEEEEEEEDETWRRRKEDNDGGEPQDWYLVVPPSVQVLVNEHLGIKFNDDQLRVDFLAGAVWAMRFATAEEYKAFVLQYQDCLFENMHKVTATEANKVKVIGKDFLKWAAGEDADEAMWDADDSFDGPPKPYPAVRETFRHSAGKGAQSLTMGALQNSYLLHEGGVDVYKNMQEGVEGGDLSFTIQGYGGASASSYVTPKKGMLMQAETSMMLMSPGQGEAGAAGTPGLQQLDIDTGKIVAKWQFQKDGTPVSIMDITSDTKESQLDPGGATFLGLHSNRLCRWDMRDRHGEVQQLGSSVLNWSDGHNFSRGTNFQCFASTGDGCIAVGSMDGKVRLYSTTTMRQAKTAFPGLGSPITHIDATYDGKWVLATTDTYLLLISTMFKDKDGREKSGFIARMGQNIAAPRVLKLNPVDAHAAGAGFKFQGGQFSWITEAGRQERNVVATVGHFSVVWNFRRVKQSEHECYRSVGEGLKTCFCYKVVPKEENIIASRFMHDNYMGASSPDAPLVVATPQMVSSFNV